MGHGIVDGLEHLAVEVGTLTADPANSRTHTPAQISLIAASLKAYGQDQPLVVQRQGMIVRKGNGRLAAALELGWTHVAAVVLDEEDAKAVARAIADNRSSDLAGWDETTLGKLLAQTRGLPTGFSVEETDRLVAFIAADGSPHFEPEPSRNVPRLDKLAPITCPKCGHTWTR